MKRKKIGFVNGDTDEEENKEGTEDPFFKMFTANKAHVKQFIENSFDPVGTTSNKEFKTSAELVYMLREFENPSMRVVNEIMNELKFQIVFIEGVPNWIVYMKESDEYMG